MNSITNRKCHDTIRIDMFLIWYIVCKVELIYVWYCILSKNYIFITLQCDGGIGTNVMYEELYNKTTTKIVILGDGCSVSTQPTAQASHLWNLVQVFTRNNSLQRYPLHCSTYCWCIADKTMNTWLIHIFVNVT